MTLSPDELLDCLGPDWGQMADADRIAYGPRSTRKSRAERIRYLIERLAEQWNGEVVWMRRAS